MATVKDIWNNGNWNLDAIQCLPDMVKGLLDLVRFQGEEENKLYWTGSSNGNFTMSSAYKMDSNRVTELRFWSLLCNLDTLRRIKFFLWTVCHNQILTKGNYVARGIMTDACCPQCLNAAETQEHLLRDYPTSMAIWSKWFHGNQLGHFL
ncbi:hypothetical protein REPUB_Repub04eG0076800 [Reevesia pubescens]